MAFFNSKKQAFARERLTVTSAVKTLTASVYNDASPVGHVPTQDGNRQRKATGARLVAESASGDFHFTEEGTDPTASVAVAGVGTLGAARDVIVLDSYEAICKFKMFSAGGADAIVEVVYFR